MKPKRYLGKRLTWNGSGCWSNWDWPALTVCQANDGSWFAMAHFASPAPITIQVTKRTSERAARRGLRRKLAALSEQLERLDL